MKQDQAIQIRSMQLNDVAVVASIEQQIQSHPWTVQQFKDSVDSYQCTVIEYQQKICGFCILQPVLDEANLLLMGIHPANQGQGFGYALLEASLAKLKNQPIQIFLEVREHNNTAIKLYEKSGFHQIDKRANYYPNPDGTREHAVIMVKSCSDDFTALFK